MGEMRASVDARVEKNEMILAKFSRYLQMIPERGLPWTEEALARVQRAPAFVQGIARSAIEEEARRRKEPVVTPEAVERVMGSIAAGAAASAAPQAGGAPQPPPG